MFLIKFMFQLRTFSRVKIDSMPFQLVSKSLQLSLTVKTFDSRGIFLSLSHHFFSFLCLRLFICFTLHAANITSPPLMYIIE